MEDQNHKEDALGCLGAAEVIAGVDGNSLNSPPAQADYFLQCGLVHAILHLADALATPKWGVSLADDDRGYEFDSGDEPTDFDRVINERPSPTMTILEENLTLDPRDATTSEPTVEEEPQVAVPSTPRTPKRRKGSKKKGT